MPYLGLQPLINECQKLTLTSFTSLPVGTARLQRHLYGDATNPVKSYAMPADCF